MPHAVITRDATTLGEPVRPGIVFEGEMRRHPPQQQAADAYRAFLASTTPHVLPAIITLPCGYGKTPWFIHTWLQLGRVGLFLVHKLPLLPQTMDEIRRFTPAARVGYVTADSVRVEGVDIVVASLQTLHSHLSKPASHPYLAVLLSRVGTVCMDEGHHAVAVTFAAVLAAVPARYRLILTATPRRKDGLMPQLQYIGGPVIFRAFRRVKEVCVVAVHYLCADHVELRRGPTYVDRAAMIERLMEDPVRDAVVLAALRELLPQGRRVLVVSPRVAHVHALGEKIVALGAELGYAPEPSRIYVRGRPPRPARRRKGETVQAAAERADRERHAWEDSGPHGEYQDCLVPVVGFVLQGMKDEDRAVQYLARVIVTTTNMMEEGVSITQLDTLVDMDNTRDPEQVIGRILRTGPGKRVPLVVDLWHDLFKGSYMQRRRFCKGERFHIQDLAVACPGDVPGGFWDQFDRPGPEAM